jgi:hypothetical protein
MYQYAYMAEGEFYKVREARKQLDNLSTPTLLSLAATYADTEGLPPLSELVCDVPNGPEWKKFFPRRVESAMMDFLSYRDHLGSKKGQFSTAAQTFNIVYKLTGRIPGSLANLSGTSRESIAALLLVVSENGHFTGNISGRTFNRQTVVIDEYISLFPKEKKADEFPAEFVAHVMANPDLADTLVEFMHQNILTANKVNWDDFMAYADTAPSLRDGVL